MDAAKERVCNAVGRAPGDVHAFYAPYEIGIGGDGWQNKLIGRVIDARPGQRLQLKVRAPSGSERERKAGEPASESGVISFAVGDGPDSGQQMPSP